MKCVKFSRTIYLTTANITKNTILLILLLLLLLVALLITIQALYLFKLTNVFNCGAMVEQIRSTIIDVVHLIEQRVLKLDGRESLHQVQGNLGFCPAGVSVTSAWLHKASSQPTRRLLFGNRNTGSI